MGASEPFEVQPAFTSEDGLTICVQWLRAKGDGELIGVGVELRNDAKGLREQRRYTLCTELFGSMSLRRGPISREQLEQLEQAAQLSDAIRRGASILACGANSARVLEQKLRQRGIKGESARQAVEWLYAHGYLREAQDAERELEACLRKQWGPRRILTHLRSRGYTSEAIEQAQDQLADVDFSARCAALARSRTGGRSLDVKEKQRLIAFLLRYGYDMDDVRLSLRSLSDASSSEGIE